MKVSMTALAALLSVWALGAWASTEQEQASTEDRELQRAIDAYVASRYAESRKLFEPLAEAGRSEAQYFLGIMYERGYEVLPDEITAQSWYLRASRLDNRKAREAAFELSKKLSPKQSREAYALAHEDRLILDKNRGCVSFFGEPFVSHYVTAFQPHASVEEMVSDILSYTGLAKNFEVQAANVPNAAAIIQGTERYLLYNPQFIQEVNQKGGTAWAAYSVMAHEIGHHLQGHTIQAGGSRPPLELEADEFSGFVLANMGADLEQAQAAMASLASLIGTSTHPARLDRLRAIETGWTGAVQKGARSGSAPSSGRGSSTSSPRRRPPTPSVQQPPLPPPSPRPSWVVARYCATSHGRCLMQVPIPVSSVCYCFGPYGYVPGYGR